MESITGMCGSICDLGQSRAGARGRASGVGGWAGAWVVSARAGDRAGRPGSVGRAGDDVVHPAVRSDELLVRGAALQVRLAPVRARVGAEERDPRAHAPK